MINNEEFFTVKDQLSSQFIMNNFELCSSAHTEHLVRFKLKVIGRKLNIYVF